MANAFRYSVLILLLWILIPAACLAIEKTKQPVQQTQTTIYMPKMAPAQPKHFLQSLEPYKPIYAVHTMFLDQEGAKQGYLDHELLLTFSFKRLIYWNLYFAYSHKAYWQIYDFENSRPFREHNYNPELFLEWDDTLRLDHIRVGLFEHESNGEKLRYDNTGTAINQSRTWNRIYVYGRKSVTSMIRLGLKFWIVTDSDDPEEGSFIVDNSDIQQYMGNGEFYAEIGKNPTYLSIMLRQGWKNGTETVRVDGRISLHELFGLQDNGVDLFAQFFAGYGDSLIDYNRHISRFSIGVAFR